MKTPLQATAAAFVSEADRGTHRSVLPFCYKERLVAVFALFVGQPVTIIGVVIGDVEPLYAHHLSVCILRYQKDSILHEVHIYLDPDAVTVGSTGQLCTDQFHIVTEYAAADDEDVSCCIETIAVSSDPYAISPRSETAMQQVLTSVFFIRTSSLFCEITVIL